MKNLNQTKNKFLITRRQNTNPCNTPLNQQEEFKDIMALAQKMYEYKDYFDNAKFCRNKKQIKKFETIVDFFERFVAHNGGKIVDISTDFTHENADITIEFWVVDLRNEWLQEYCEVLKLADMVDMEAHLDGKVCIDVTVRNVQEIIF